MEMQPELWRMSKKDGKAVLLRAVEKKQIHQLELSPIFIARSKEVVEACPARVIKIG
jgi:ferredoxin